MGLSWTWLTQKKLAPKTAVEMLIGLELCHALNIKEKET